MTRDVLKTAIEEGVPFVITMADGKEYEVTDRLHIALGKEKAVVMDERACPHLLPLLTIASVNYLSPDRGSTAAK